MLCSFQDFCAKLKNLPEDKIDELYIQRDINTGKPQVDCFIEGMSDFMQVLSLYTNNKSYSFVRTPLVGYIIISRCVKVLDDRPNHIDVSVFGLKTLTDLHSIACSLLK